MADVAEAAEAAPGKAAGLATKRIGPLPVWAWAGGLVGGLLAFSVFSRIGGGGGTATASTATPKTSSQSAGPAALGAGPDAPINNSGSSNNDSILASLVQAVSDLAGRVGGASGGSAGSAGIATAPATPVPAPQQNHTIENIATDPAGRYAIDIITNGPPVASTPGSGLGSQPSVGTVELTNSAGGSTGALPGLQETGNAPGVSYENGNLVVR